ncbi:MAG: processing protein [Solirubrobacterales bacterium]|jgi:DNA processing protein|nr:processing protein [Solirubrobacterales bacterium]
MAADTRTATRDRLHLLALCMIEGANWNVLAREAQRPEGLVRLLAGKIAEDSRDGRATGDLVRAALGSLEERLERAEAEVGGAAEAGARLVTVLDDGYPSNLRVVPKLPPFLFYRGELRRDDARSVAVVGTRRASEEGIGRARTLAQLLVDEGVTVISGLAKGIDTAAHSAVLDAEGRTIAVVGTGILRVYPKENAELAERIVERGAIVSQFWPTAPPTRYSFPMRNEVMSGISQGTAVIEASSTSGAKMQARLALEQGKRAFLMSSLVTREKWAKSYIEKRGAIEVHSVNDVVRWLRSAEQVELQSSQRSQLELDLV